MATTWHYEMMNTFIETKEVMIWNYKYVKENANECP